MRRGDDAMPVALRSGAGEGQGWRENAPGHDAEGRVAWRACDARAQQQLMGCRVFLGTGAWLLLTLPAPSSDALPWDRPSASGRFQPGRHRAGWFRTTPSARRCQDDPHVSRCRALPCECLTVRLHPRRSHRPTGKARSRTRAPARRKPPTPRYTKHQAYARLASAAKSSTMRSASFWKPSLKANPVSRLLTSKSRSNATLQPSLPSGVKVHSPCSQSNGPSTNCILMVRGRSSVLRVEKCWVTPAKRKSRRATRCSPSCSETFAPRHHAKRLG